MKAEKIFIPACGALHQASWDKKSESDLEYLRSDLSPDKEREMLQAEIDRLKNEPKTIIYESAEEWLLDPPSVINDMIRREAVGFAEWLKDNRWWKTPSGYWSRKHYEKLIATTDELFTEYLKSR